MRSLAWLVPLALVAAGCVSPGETPAATLASDPVPLLGKVMAYQAGGAPLPLPEDVPTMLAKTLEHDGPEPTLGVTSNGYVFFVAMEKVLRSADGGQTWEVVSTPVSSPTTLDPYLYVDPDTDRVWSDQLYLGCSYLSWSDDYGETWVTNPAACGLPVNDHQKLVSAKNRGPIPSVLYPKPLFYGYNDVAPGGSRVSVSFDGGLTWPVNSQTVPPGACAGGLHGNFVADSEGNVYLPKRDCEGFVFSKSSDSGLTWASKSVGVDAGGSACLKNPDLAVDSANNLYGVWPGKDNHLYLTTSLDQGETWREESVDLSGPITMTTMPAIVAGDPGRIAVAYYGTVDDAKGPDEVNESALWHLYVTYSLNALDEVPEFVTVQVSADPIQVGGISTNSGCDAPPGSRNLLDFIDAQMDAQGRLFVAYADGCVDKCVNSLDMKDSRSALGTFAVLETGPSLLDAVGTLTVPFAGLAEAAPAQRAPVDAPSMS